MREKIFKIVIFVLAVSVPGTVQFLGNDIFSSGDERLFQIFCVKDKAELAEIGKTTWSVHFFWGGESLPLFHLLSSFSHSNIYDNFNTN